MDGAATSGKGVRGTATSGTGVYGEAASGNAVYGKDTGFGFGVTGECGSAVGGQFFGALGAVMYGTVRHAEFGLAGGGAIPAAVELDGSYSVNNIQVLTTQQAAVTHANTAHACASFADVNTALDALGTIVNDLLTKLETHGLIA